MKIGIITNLYPPLVRGGAEWLTYLVAQEFVKQGHQVAVITLASPGAPKSEQGVAKDEEGVIVYRFDPGYIYHYLNAAEHPKLWRLIWQIQHMVNIPLHNQIVRALTDEHCDLIISSNLMGLTFNLPRALKYLARSYIHIVHDVQLLHPSGLFMVGASRGGWAESIYQAITRWLFASPTLVVFPSRWLASEYQTRHFFPSSQMEILKNPSPVINSTAALPKSPKLTLLYVGQAAEHKGVFWLIESLKNTTKRDWKLDIVLLGQTGDRQRINQLIADDSRFKVFDSLPQTEINQKYQEASVVVVPSLCLENSPVSIQLALSSGTPVLAARVGGIPELIQEDKNGWLFEADNAQDFYLKLAKATPQNLEDIQSQINKNYQPVSLADYCHNLLALVK